jgi:hypothetical protein
LSYTIAIDHNKIDEDYYNLQIKLFNYDFSKLRKFLKENKKVKYFNKQIGI